MLEMLPEEVLSELDMTINAKKNILAVVLVEGETDRALYSSLFNEKFSENIIVYAAGNRDLVLKVTDLTSIKDDHNVEHLVALIDQDYLVPLNMAPTSGNLFITDFRDIECMMLHSPAFKAVCDEYVDWEKAKRLNLENVSDIRSSIINICFPLGKLRYWSQAIGKHYVFKKLDVSECISRNGADLDKKKVLDKLRGAQVKNNTIPNDAFEEADRLCISQSHFASEYFVCRGHDLSEIIAAQIRKKIGKSYARNILACDVERNLRMAFPRFWNSFNQIKQIKLWFATNGLGHILS